MPSDWREMRQLTGKIDSLMQDIGVYVEDVEISDYSGVTTFDLRMSTSGYESNPDGYEEFLENLKEHEDKYDAMLRVIEKHLAEEEYIGPIEFDRFREEDLVKFGESLKNFNGVYNRSIDLSKYPTAIYILQLNTKDGMVNKKLILE